MFVSRVSRFGTQMVKHLTKGFSLVENCFWFISHLTLTCSMLVAQLNIMLIAATLVVLLNCSQLPNSRTLINVQ